MKKVAAMAANVSKEADEINAAIEAEVKTPVKRTIILPEGVTGAQLKRKVIPQTSAKAAELNPKLKPLVDSAKESAKEGTVTKTGILAKAKAAKAEKAEKTGKKTVTAKAKAAKYVQGITSMEKLGDYCLAQGWDEKSKETKKVFVDAYKLKNGLTDITEEMDAFITPRSVIYMNIARKKAAKTAVPLTKTETIVVKEKMVRKATA